MLKNNNPILFADFSLTEKSKKWIQEHQIELKPPVKRGDIKSLIANGFQGVLIIADGLFLQDIPVGHREIMQALQNDCQVYGLSAIGAIRAYEIEKFGMIGFGEVFHHFKNENDFQDDEVLYLYENVGGNYQSKSEPLVHFRACLKDFIAKGQLPELVGETILTQLKACWFRERTFSLFTNLLHQYSEGVITLTSVDFEKYQIQKTDLESFLEKSIWLDKK